MPCKRGAMHSGRAALIPSRAMPAFAFILGVVPLVLATGAGEVSRPGTRVGRFWIRLIGVTTAIVSPSGTNAGVGFAIPVDSVNRVVPELIRRSQL